MMGKDRGPVLIGNVLAFGITSFGIVVLRICFRIHRRWTDASDWCIAIALATSLCQDAFNAACITQWGYGKHRADLPSSIVHSEVPLKLYWLNQIFFKVTTLFTKLSLCIVYLRLFQRINSLVVRWTRIVIYATAFLVISYYGAAFLVSIFQCTPVSKTWRAKEAGTCIDLTSFRFSTAAINIFTSVLVITVPLPALFQIKHRGAEITQLIFLILLGVIHTGCTIGRLVLMVYPDPVTKSDPQWASLPSNTLAIVEMNVGIIAASLVVMRSCFQAIFSTISGRNNQRYTVSSASGSGVSSVKMGSRQIMRTVEIEMDTQVLSTINSLRGHDQFQRMDWQAPSVAV